MQTRFTLPRSPARNAGTWKLPAWTITVPPRPTASMFSSMASSISGSRFLGDSIRPCPESKA